MVSAARLPITPAPTMPTLARSGGMARALLAMQVNGGASREALGRAQDARVAADDLLRMAHGLGEVMHRNETHAARVLRCLRAYHQHGRRPQAEDAAAAD